MSSGIGLGYIISYLLYSSVLAVSHSNELLRSSAPLSVIDYERLCRIRTYVNINARVVDMALGNSDVWQVYEVIYGVPCDITCQFDKLGFI